jgi:hypothetical protein
VYDAIEHEVGRPVALEVLSDADAAAGERMNQEFRIAAGEVDGLDAVRVVRGEIAAVARCAEGSSAAASAATAT